MQFTWFTWWSHSGDWCDVCMICEWMVSVNKYIWLSRDDCVNNRVITTYYPPSDPMSQDTQFFSYCVWLCKMNDVNLLNCCCLFEWLIVLFMNALMWCVYVDRPRCLELLIAANADINKAKHGGYTPVYIACFKGMIAMNAMNMWYEITYDDIWWTSNPIVMMYDELLVLIIYRVWWCIELLLWSCCWNVMPLWWHVMNNRQCTMLEVDDRGWSWFGDTRQQWHHPNHDRMWKRYYHISAMTWCIRVMMTDVWLNREHESVASVGWSWHWFYSKESEGW